VFYDPVIDRFNAIIFDAAGNDECMLVQATLNQRTANRRVILFSE
jgi:hypothetical protein